MKKIFGQNAGYIHKSLCQFASFSSSGLSFFLWMPMTKEGEDILEEETLVFKPSLWIGCQKQYKDVPLHVCNALSLLWQLPHGFHQFLPHPMLPVRLDFINLQLPCQSAKLITAKINQVLFPKPLLFF